MNIKIHLHRHREKGVKYLEDIYTQFELLSIDSVQAKEIFEKYGNNIYVCSNSLPNVIGRMIACGLCDKNDFEIIADSLGYRYTESGFWILDW